MIIYFILLCRSRCSTKENRIPIGKKKDNINKLKDLKKSM